MKKARTENCYWIEKIELIDTVKTKEVAKSVVSELNYKNDDDCVYRFVCAIPAEKNKKLLEIKYGGMFDTVDFRTQLKETREIFNINQYEFATSLGISVKHLNRIENCHQYPSFPLLYEICSRLGYDLKLQYNPSGQ